MMVGRVCGMMPFGTGICRYIFIIISSSLLYIYLFLPVNGIDKLGGRVDDISML